MMRNSAAKSDGGERQISQATERMARILGANFERNDRGQVSKSDGRKQAAS